MHGRPRSRDALLAFSPPRSGLRALRGPPPPGAGPAGVGAPAVARAPSRTARSRLRPELQRADPGRAAALARHHPGVGPTLPLRGRPALGALRALGAPAPLPRGAGAGRRAGPRGQLGGGPPHLPAARGSAGKPRPRAVRPTADRNPVRSPRAPAAGAPRWLISWPRLEAGLAGARDADARAETPHRADGALRGDRRADVLTEGDQQVVVADPVPAGQADPPRPPPPFPGRGSPL